MQLLLSPDVDIASGEVPHAHSLLASAFQGAGANGLINRPKSVFLLGTLIDSKDVSKQIRNVLLADDGVVVLVPGARYRKASREPNSPIFEVCLISLGIRRVKGGE